MSKTQKTHLQAIGLSHHTAECGTNGLLICTPDERLVDCRKCLQIIQIIANARRTSSLRLKARRFFVSNNGSLIAVAKDEYCPRVSVAASDIDRFGVVRQYGRSGTFLVAELSPAASIMFDLLGPCKVFFVMGEQDAEAKRELKAIRKKLPSLKHMPAGRTSEWRWLESDAIRRPDALASSPRKTTFLFHDGRHMCHDCGKWPVIGEGWQLCESCNRALAYRRVAAAAVETAENKKAPAND